MGARKEKRVRRLVRKESELVTRQYLTKIQDLRLRDRLRFAWYIVAKVREKPPQSRRR